MGPGGPLKVRLLYEAKPLAGERLSFIPRAATLQPETDARYEPTTDARGEAAFSPNEANHHLFVAHKTEPKQGGMLDSKPYELAKYSATLSVFVPRLCP